MIKYRIKSMLLAASLLVPSVSMASNDEPEIARALNPVVRWVDNGIISLDFTCPAGVEMGGENMIRITPTVKREGRPVLKFASVIYLSKAGKRYFDRRMAYRPDASLAGSHILLPHRSSEGEEYHYTDTLAVGSMGDGCLEINYYYTDCCHEYLLLSDTVDVAPAPEVKYHYEVLPMPVLVNRLPIQPSSVVFRAPTGEETKVRTQTARIPLNFRQGNTDIDVNYMDNRVHLQKTDSILRPMLDRSDDYTISRMSITGYASPEGEYYYNMKLSEDRAAAFSGYITSRYGSIVSEITSTGVGEDWDGLCREIEADPYMPLRSEVMSIINGYGIFEGREKKLMELDFGRPYIYMQDNFFPLLRRMELFMEYSVRHFEKDEVVGVLQSRPQDLDTYELYSAARRLNPDSLITNGSRTGYGKEYDVAASLHPEDVLTQINAASAALLRHDLEAAYRYLNKLYNEPLAWNNIGVYYWMCGNLEEAREFFRRALSVSPEAETNLKQLESAREKSVNNKKE